MVQSSKTDFREYGESMRIAANLFVAYFQAYAANLSTGPEIEAEDLLVITIAGPSSLEIQQPRLSSALEAKAKDSPVPVVHCP